MLRSTQFCRINGSEGSQKEVTLSGWGTSPVSNETATVGCGELYWRCGWRPHASVLSLLSTRENRLNELPHVDVDITTALKIGPKPATLGPHSVTVLEWNKATEETRSREKGSQSITLS